MGEGTTVHRPEAVREGGEGEAGREGEGDGIVSEPNQEGPPRNGKEFGAHLRAVERRSDVYKDNVTIFWFHSGSKHGGQETGHKNDPIPAHLKCKCGKVEKLRSFPQNVWEPIQYEISHCLSGVRIHLAQMEISDASQGGGQRRMGKVPVPWP